MTQLIPAIEKSDIKKQLQALLNDIRKYFEPDELAYYSAQCKNELQIRDGIAWQLHKYINEKYGDKYVVRREWAPEGYGKKRVDIAILEMDEQKENVENVIALIEFKAQSIARSEKWYLDEFTKDVKKMRDIKHYDKKTCKNADLYFVFLETGQGEEAENSKKYKSVLGFSKYEDRCVYCDGPQDENYLQTVYSHWKEFEGLLDESISIHEPKAIYIGEAFGYKQYVSPLVIGPLEYNRD